MNHKNIHDSKYRSDKSYLNSSISSNSSSGQMFEDETHTKHKIEEMSSECRNDEISVGCMLNIVDMPSDILASILFKFNLKNNPRIYLCLSRSLYVKIMKVLQCCRSLVTYDHSIISMYPYLRELTLRHLPRICPFSLEIVQTNYVQNIPNPNIVQTDRLCLRSTFDETLGSLNILNTNIMRFLDTSEFKHIIRISPNNIKVLRSNICQINDSFLNSFQSLTSLYIIGDGNISIPSKLSNQLLALECRGWANITFQSMNNLRRLKLINITGMIHLDLPKSDNLVELSICGYFLNIVHPSLRNLKVDKSEIMSVICPELLSIDIVDSYIHNILSLPKIRSIFASGSIVEYEEFMMKLIV